MYAECSFKGLKNKRKKSLFTCLTINGYGRRKLAPNEKGVRPLKENSGWRNKRRVRYGLALAPEKNNQQTKNLFGTFWEFWVASEDSQHHEIYDKETLVSAIGSPAGLRLIIWFSGIVGVTVLHKIPTWIPNAWFTMSYWLWSGCLSKGNTTSCISRQRIKDKDIDDCRHILL